MLDFCFFGSVPISNVQFVNAVVNLEIDDEEKIFKSELFWKYMVIVIMNNKSVSIQNLYMLAYVK